jgi:hypothetical protein
MILLEQSRGDFPMFELVVADFVVGGSVKWNPRVAAAERLADLHGEGPMKILQVKTVPRLTWTMPDTYRPKPGSQILVVTTASGRTLELPACWFQSTEDQFQSWAA